MKSELTSAQQIWEEIKNKKLDLFALPNQLVSQYCETVEVEPSKLYLKLKMQSVLPALEKALGENFTVEQVTKYTTVERKTNVE
jgi:hypothetical protein